MTLLESAQAAMEMVFQIWGAAKLYRSNKGNEQHLDYMRELVLRNTTEQEKRDLEPELRP